MTGGQKGLTFFAVLSGLLWVILGLVGAKKANEASLFGTDSDLATVVALKSASGDSFLIMMVAIVGLCVAAAVREMLNPSAEAADKPGTVAVAAATVTTPAAAPAEVAEPSDSPDVRPGEPHALPGEPVNAEQRSE